MAMTSMFLKNKHHKKKFAKRMQVMVRQWGQREAATEECRPIFIAAKMVIVQCNSDRTLRETEMKTKSFSHTSSSSDWCVRFDSFVRVYVYSLAVTPVYSVFEWGECISGLVPCIYLTIDTRTLPSTRWQHVLLTPDYHVQDKEMRRKGSRDALLDGNNVAVIWTLIN